MIIGVTYQCWGCGSEKVVYEEEEDESIPSRVVWNICPHCLKKKGGEKGEKKVASYSA